MKKIMKSLAFTAAFAVLATAFTACGTKDETADQTSASVQSSTTSASTQKDPAKQAAEQPYELDFLSGMDPSRPVNPEKDILMQEMEQKLNVKFKIEYVDVQQYGQKLSLRIASGSIPDIVNITGGAGVTLDDYKRYAVQNVFADLTDRISEKDTPNLIKEISKDVLDKAKVKGKIYGIPKNSGPGAGFRFNVMYRKDYLDAIGAQPATTLEEYYTLLGKIKKAKPDVIPLGAFGGLGEQRFSSNSFDHIIGAFSVQPGYFYLDGDKVESYDIHPKMKEALAYLQKMYSEGLIDREFATLKEPNMREKYISGKIFSDISWWSNPANYDKDIEIFELKKAGKLPADGTIKENLVNEPFKYLQFGRVLTGSDGKNVAGFGAEFGQFTCISAKTKDVARVLSIIDQACILENNMYANWGKEGRDYEIKDGKLDPSLQGTADPKTNLWPDGYCRSFGLASYAPNIKGVPRYMEGLPLRIVEPLKNSLGTPGQIADAAAFLSSDTKTAKFKELCTLRDTVWTQIIMGADINKFDEFVAKWKAQGGDDITKELTASYKEQQGK